MLEYHPLYCLAVSMPELVDVILDTVLRNNKLLVLEDIIKAESALLGVTHDFRNSVKTIGLIQVISSPIYYAGHTLGLVF